MLHSLAHHELIANISSYCDDRLVPIMGTKIKAFLLSLLRRQKLPPAVGRRFNWTVISREAGIGHSLLVSNKSVVRSALYLIHSHITAAGSDDNNPRVPATYQMLSDEIYDEMREMSELIRSTTEKCKRFESNLKIFTEGHFLPPVVDPCDLDTMEFSNNNFAVSKPSFSGKLCNLMRLQQISIEDITDYLQADFGRVNSKLIRDWQSGTLPKTIRSLNIINSIEKKWGDVAFCLLAYVDNYSAKKYMLSTYFSKKRDCSLIISHLPDNYWFVSEEERQEINTWMRENMLGGATAYRRYAIKARGVPFQIKLEHHPADDSAKQKISHKSPGRDANDDCPASRPRTITAPPRLQYEIDKLILFKTSSITDENYRRHNKWSDSTADIIRLNFGLLFGAVHAPADGPVKGCGVPLEHLSLALLVFPDFWKWYLEWRKMRRGNFSAAEITILNYARGWLRRKTGWIAQNESLIDGVMPIIDQRTGNVLISQGAIDEARSNWKRACKKMYKRMLQLVRDVSDNVQKSRNPFDAIRPVLQSDEPMRVYKQIADEILLCPANAASGRFGEAEKSRSYLIIRVASQLGSRSKNLRELLVCPRDQRPRALNELMILKRGELRWSDEDNAWEVVIPKSAFKNSGSKYFKSGPFRKVLKYDPILYRIIDEYITIHRATLLAGRADPGTLFIKGPHKGAEDASYGSQAFYSAYSTIIRNYGIYNPYTGKGAITGLLPHGPHAVRDVRATHILKATGSYEQAAYSIQDDVATIELYYAEFDPHDREKIVSRILDPVWEAMAA